MISWLSGVVLLVSEDSIVLNVSNVGYLIYCPSAVLSSAQHGTKLELWIDMEIKQDDHILTGFVDIESRTCYRMLKSVQGVGTKLALAIMGHYSCPDILSFIVNKEYVKLQAVSGVGAKIAERIANELHKKAQLMVRECQSAQMSMVHSQASNVLSDIISALVILGFNRAEASMAAQKMIDEHGEKLGISELIRHTLAYLTRLKNINT